MKKMDEMEMSISLKAIKIAYVYSIIFLFIWMMFEWIQDGTRGLPFFLLLTQNLVLLGTHSLLKWKMGKDEK